MTDWEPATEAETAMRDALRAADQELYFRLLARTELLLPVSPEALAGRAPMGWGTWNSGGRTHVLAFTSAESMRACLAEHAGSARRIAYHELAGAWPNHEWWLAVNPGLPIEGYLPPWFVTQLARGDVRMPGRTTGVRSRAYATAPADSSVRNIGVEQTYQPFGGRTQSPPPRGAGAAAATGARREAARATATAARDAFTPTPPPPPDEPIEAEMVDTDSTSVRSDGAHSAGRSVTASGRPDGPSRRPRRHDATIIDAEIIESTVLGMTALDAMVVNATVIDASTFDSDVIDATLIDLSVEDTGARVARMRRTGTQPGLTAAPSAAADSPNGADRTHRAEDPASRRVDQVAAAANDASPTRPINRRPTPPADATQRIDPRAAEAARAAADTARAARRRRTRRAQRERPTRRRMRHSGSIRAPRPRRVRPRTRHAARRRTLRSGSMRATGPRHHRPMPRSASIRRRPRPRARTPERRVARLRMRRSGSIRGWARTPRRRGRSMCARARRRPRMPRSGSICKPRMPGGQRRPCGQHGPRAQRRRPRVLPLQTPRSGSTSTPTHRRPVASTSPGEARHRLAPVRSARTRRPRLAPGAASNDRRNRRALMTASRPTARCGRTTTPQRPTQLRRLRALHP